MLESAVRLERESASKKAHARLVENGSNRPKLTYKLKLFICTTPNVFVMNSSLKLLAPLKLEKSSTIFFLPFDIINLNGIKVVLYNRTLKLNK